MTRARDTDVAPRTTLPARPMRDAKRCDSCGIMGRSWATVALLRDGRLAIQFVLCLACASNAEDAVRRARRAPASRHYRIAS